MKRFRGTLAIAVLGTVIGGAARAEQAAGHKARGQAAEIRSRLQKDPDLKNSRIDVTVDDGIAKLTGTVDSDAEKLNAGDLAMVKGIVGVQNQLDVGRVRTTSTSLDDALTSRIKAQITHDWMAVIADVSVTANGDVVTLTGSVPSEQARAEALQVARSAEGVRRVESALTIASKK